MAQNPTVVGQQQTNGLSMVDQINAALVSLATGVMGAADPSEGVDHQMGPGFMWLDTGEDAGANEAAIKIRDAANENWVVIGYINGQPSPTLTAILGTKLALAGGTLTGFLTLHADPDEPLKAATKQYVDTVSRPAPVRFFQQGNATVQDGIGYALIEQNCILDGIIARSLDTVAGSDLIVRLTRGGVSGAASRTATIPIGSTLINAAVTDLALVPGDFLRFDVTQAGSAGGAPLMVTGHLRA